MNIQEFVEQHNIKMDVTYLSERTDGFMWDNANHYTCVFSNELIVQYSMGYGITGPPTAAVVLDSLAANAVLLENEGTFEDWCTALGLNDDSIKEKRSYDLAVTQSSELVNYLGQETYYELLWKVERM